jgi:hypothetical protein
LVIFSLRVASGSAPINAVFPAGGQDQVQNMGSRGGAEHAEEEFEPQRAKDHKVYCALRVAIHPSCSLCPDKKTKPLGSRKSGDSAIFMDGGSAVGRWPTLW